MQWALTAMFLLALLAPSIMQFSGVELHRSDFELRLKAELPAFPQTMRDLSRLPKQFDRWYSDHFGLRATMIRAYVLAKYHLLGAIQVNKVVFGRDGWLFFTDADPTIDPIASYRGTTLLTQAELAEITVNLNAWDEWCRARGIVFALLIAPNKSMIFPEKLPPGLGPVPRPNRLAIFMEHMRQHATPLVVDPTPRLLAHKQERIYYKTDSHWTSLGAMYATQLLQEQMAPRLTAAGKDGIWAPLQLSDYTVTEIPRNGGDLAHMVILADDVQDVNMQLTPLHDRNATAVAAGVQRPRVVLYGDSFSVFLPEFLAQDFDIITTPQNQSLDPAFIEKQQPSLLIMEIVERKLPKLIDRTRSIRFLPQIQAP
ncbi:hypothetical protein DGI_0325 [Megalodesulfovibrio gigas DSM 1382 = ATCC 19364]|uniref:AlgX/AlgJ SGNH hydrolase-like domain-containing protein n=2 Tax=Megalodesulfovibrio gigas TaxID=879 RepID=T2G8M8_MEGG1|nr:hypothetical protein DGI_0325 [Megalodesulfovibrio gigas DSM 1382 = ATCC 19364]